jgi:hypothetical protein
VYFSQGITENQDDPVKKEWFNFLREMRFFSMRRLLRFDTRDVAKTNLDKNDFKHLAKTQAPKEQEDMNTMNENKNTRQRVSENALRQEMENSAETMTLDQFCSVYGDDDWVVKFWHDANPGQSGHLHELSKDTVKSYANKKSAELSDVPTMPFKKKPMSDRENRNADKGMMGALARLGGVKPTSSLKDQGMSEDMDSLTFWKQQAQKAGGSDKIDWHAIGIEHGRQGINLNPPYGAGDRAVTLYGKGLDAGAQGVSEGDDTPGYIKYEQMKDQIAKVLVKLYHQGTDSETIKQMGDRVAKHLGYDPDDEIFQTAWTRSFNDASLDGAFDDTDADDHTDYSMRQGEMGNPDRMRGIQEGRWNNKSSRKTSRAVQGKTEVIVRHARPVDEEYAGSRSQRKNIKAIYIQNADGERFKYPFIHTAGAFAMAQHVDHGGTPHDPAGRAIVQMSEEIAKLAEFHRKIHRATLHQDASGITERAMIRMNELKSQIEALGKRQHYQNWMETVSSDSMASPSMEELDAVTMEQYKQKFTQTNFQEELSAYFPLLHRIMSETNRIDLEDYVEEDLVNVFNTATEAFDIGMGQASHGKGHPDEQFAEWAEAVEQGILTTDQIGELKQAKKGILTTDQIGELKQAISELPQGETGPELELGPDGTTAIEFFQGLGLNNDDLNKKLKAMYQVDIEADALKVFRIWSDNYPELAVALGISDTDTSAEEPTAADQQPAPEAPKQPTAENDDMTMNKGTMSARESVVKEVAKLVKSRFNEDNPDVGPFNGKENIALDVKKKCAEMFGDEVGEQAEQLAMQFMEKLSRRWEEKHGKVEDDGLARLKELLGNVKAKVEGIGDNTNNGHAPGTNIMPAEEGIGTKILGGAALIAALWGVNNHLANQAYEASPQLQKLTQFYQKAEAQHDAAAMKELKQRIEGHKARLDLGYGDVMDKSGNPKEVVPEMADILKLSGLTK